MSDEERAVSFHGKKVGPRAAIVAAGPIANFLLAIVIFAALFTFFGKPNPERTGRHRSGKQCGGCRRFQSPVTW